MDQFQLIESLKNLTKTSCDTALNYATRSIMPQLYEDKIDFLIFVLLGLVLFIFYYLGAIQSESKEN